MKNNTSEKWPKKLPLLTKEQQRIKDDFFNQWLHTLPKKFGAVEIFNQNYPAKIFKKDRSRKKQWKTLEIGGGLGSHIPYENLKIQSYTILELRSQLVSDLKERYPHTDVIVGDCQKPYAKKGSFDRVIAIHVLEHLPNLPEALRQMHYVLKRKGVAHIVIPCEGSLAYSFCRKISAERLFHRLYHTDYRWFIKSEHINLPDEIIEEIEKYFVIRYKRYFPIPLPFQFCNIAIGMTLYPRSEIQK